MNSFEKIKKFLDEHSIVYYTSVDFKLSKIIIPYEDIVISFTPFMDDYKTIVYIEVNGKEYAKMYLIERYLDIIWNDCVDKVNHLNI